jgi:Mismatch repair ATPase (MutS family)
LAATHDLELTTLLADTFEQIFFEEKIDENNLSFDYKIAFKHSGRMNAIRILELYQFPQEIIEEALITVKTKG